MTQLLRRMWIDPPAGHEFRRLASMCELWAQEFVHKNAKALPAGLDPGLARKGLALFRALPACGAREVLLCTDLHAGNVLAAEREPWLLIDPKPYVGDPTYDALQHMLNCDRRLYGDPGAWLTAWPACSTSTPTVCCCGCSPVAYRITRVAGAGRGRPEGGAPIVDRRTVMSAQRNNGSRDRSRGWSERPRGGGVDLQPDQVGC